MKEFARINALHGWKPDLRNGAGALPDRIYGLTEDAALAYGAIMGEAARAGRSMTAPDGMIAAIAKINGGRLATRNLADFERTGLDVISPWDF